MDSETDELFTRNSVAQVKEIQRRLRYGQMTRQCSMHSHVRLPRNDADAKQEELRLMVGYVPTHSSLPQIITIL